MNPETKEDFDEYAQVCMCVYSIVYLHCSINTSSLFGAVVQILSEYITKHSGNYLYMHLIKAVVQNVTTDFKADEYKVTLDCKRRSRETAAPI
jgi:hypothetical protein